LKMDPGKDSGPTSTVFGRERRSMTRQPEQALARPLRQPPH